MCSGVVACVAAALLYAYGAERQCDVVHDYKDVVRVDAFLVSPIAHGITAEVHVSGGLKQHELLVFEAHACDVAVTFRGKRNIGRLCKGVQCHKANVVARCGVFLAYVAEPNNEVFHTGITCRLLRQLQHRVRRG